MLIGSGFVLVAWIVLWIYAFVDAITSDPVQVRLLPKTVWVILILLFSGFAAIGWLIFGRPRATAGARQPTARTLSWQSGESPVRRQPSVRSNPVAPDDNPEFLQQLRRDINRDNNRGKPRNDDSGPSTD